MPHEFDGGFQRNGPIERIGDVVIAGGNVFQVRLDTKHLREVFHMHTPCFGPVEPSHQQHASGPKRVEFRRNGLELFLVYKLSFRHIHAELFGERQHGIFVFGDADVVQRTGTWR